MAGRALADHRDGVLHGGRHRDRADLGLHHAGLDLGEVEQIIQQSQQVLARAEDVAQVLVLPVVQVTEVPLQKHLGEADHGVQRRPELVRHVGQEVRLVLAHHLQLGTLLLQLTEQLGVVDRHRGLAGEGLQELHRLRGEAAGRAAAHHQRSDDARVTKDRDGQYGAPAVGVQQFEVRVEVDVGQVGHGHRVTFQGGPAHQGGLQLDPRSGAAGPATRGCSRTRRAPRRSARPPDTPSPSRRRSRRTERRS